MLALGSHIDTVKQGWAISVALELTAGKMFNYLKKVPLVL
jgi:hypothetical protein